MPHTTYKINRDLASLLKDLPISADFSLYINDESERPSPTELKHIYNTLRTRVRPYLAKRTLKALNLVLKTDQNKLNDPIEVTFHLYEKRIVDPDLVDRMLKKMACNSCTKTEGSALVKDLENYFKLANDFNKSDFLKLSAVFILSISGFLPLFMVVISAFIPLSFIMLPIILGISTGLMVLSVVLVLIERFIPQFSVSLLPKRLQSILSDVAILEKSIETKLNSELPPSYEESVKAEDKLPSYTEATSSSLFFVKSAAIDITCETEQNQNDQQPYLAR
jgi:hypothetical protein